MAEGEKFNLDEVEAHKFEPAETKREKFAADEGDDDVEGHKHEPTLGEKFNAPADEDDDVEAHKH